MIDQFYEEPIQASHDRDSFDCGDERLNDFLRRFARKTHERGGAKTFVTLNQDKKIIGFYSLCPASIEFEQAPEIIRRGLARHEVPVYRLARLAIDNSEQGKGIGGELLLAAGERCLKVAAVAGGVAMIINAKSTEIAKWYQRFGAVSTLDNPLTLFLPLKTLQQALQLQPLAPNVEL